MNGMLVGYLVSVWVLLAFILAALGRIEKAIRESGGGNG